MGIAQSIPKPRSCRIERALVAIVLLFATASTGHAQPAPGINVVVEASPAARQVACAARTEFGRNQNVAVTEHESEPHLARREFCGGSAQVLVASRSSMALAGDLCRGVEVLEAPLAGDVSMFVNARALTVLGNVPLAGQELFLRRFANPDSPRGSAAGFVTEILSRLAQQPARQFRRPSASLTADSPVITRGERTNLHWRSDNASVVSIDPNVLAPTCDELRGAREVSPSETTTYTLTASGLGGRTPAQQTVKVIDPPPRGELQADPAEVAAGETFTLRWAGTNANSAAISGVGPVDPNGGTMQRSITETTTYTLTLEGPGGQTTARRTVKFIEAPKADLSIRPPRVARGETVTLRWRGTNASSASIDNSVGPVDPTGGTMRRSVTETTTYTLTLTGRGGTTTKQATVFVKPEGRVWAEPSTVARDETFTLRWTGTNADFATIDNGVGQVAVESGEKPLSLSATTTYTLTLKGPGGTTTSRETVTVVEPPVGTLSAEPSTVARGETFKLRWTGTRADSAAIDNGVGDVAPERGQTALSVAATTSYTLTLKGRGGTATRQATVTVVEPPQGRLWSEPPSVPPGGVADLHWTSTNADTAEIDNGVGEVTPESGTKRLSINAPNTYTLTLKGRGGTTTIKTTVAILPPQGTFSVDPSSPIHPGDAASLQWTSTNATSASIDNDVGVLSNVAADSVSVTPAETTIYTLTLVGAGGQITRTARVEVVPRSYWWVWLIGAITAGGGAALSYWRPWEKTNNQPVRPPPVPPLTTKIVLPDAPSHSISDPTGLEIEIRYQIVSDVPPTITIVPEDAADENTNGSNQS